MIKLTNLSKTMRKKQLVAPLDYTLPKGKILALCGGNGAGKSTLIRLITGLNQPTTGHVTINGQTKRNQQIKEFGYMPDDFVFQKSITAQETLRFYARLKKLSNARMERTLDKVGLYEKRREKVGTFSKGMNQRLLLAQALLANPNLLILDEPTNGLDPYWVQQFSEIMIQAREAGQTVIFATHDLHVAAAIADEVIFLRAGEKISQGPIEQFKDVGLYETFQQLYFS